MIKNNQFGRSMIEMLGVLAIIGLLSAGGLVGYTIAMQNYRASETVDAIQKATVIAQDFYGGDYTDLSCENLASLGAFPGTSTGCPKPIAGESWTWEVDDTDISKFVLTLTGVELLACSKLGQANWGTASTFVSLEINGEQVSSPTTPPPVDVVVEQCRRGGESNELVWTFR